MEGIMPYLNVFVFAFVELTAIKQPLVHTLGFAPWPSPRNVPF